MKLIVTLNGQPAELELSAEAIAAVRGGLNAETVIEGYKGLSEALAGAGIKKSPKTLERWCMAGKLPHTRFSRRPKFVLSQVVQRIKGE